MDKKVDLKAINQIEINKFEDIMKNWVNGDELVTKIQAKMRYEIIRNFYNTKIGKKLEVQELQHSRFTFDPFMLAINTMIAEFLYNQKFYFTLSVFIMESSQLKELPNFEKDNFRFNKNEIFDILQLIGIEKTDKNNQRLLKKYLSSDKMQPLIYLLIKQFVKIRKPVIVSSVRTQTEDLHPMKPVSPIPQKIKLKKRKRRNHSLHKLEFNRKIHKQERSNENLELIAENLSGMNKTINGISVKLDNLKNSKDPELQDDKKEIVDLVGSTCKNLNECINNFEKLCDNIQQTKEISQTEKTFDDWVNELENSEHGKKFCRKLRRSYTSMLKEERSKIKREYRKKFSNEKYRMRKDKQQKQSKSFNLIDDKLKELDVKEKSLENKLNLLDKKLAEPKNQQPKTNNVEVQESNNAVNEITDFLKNTCLALKTLEKENELYEKSLQINVERNNLDKQRLQKDKENIYEEFKMKGKKFAILKKMEKTKDRKAKFISSSSSSSISSSKPDYKKISGKSNQSTSRSSGNEVLV